MTFLEIFIIAVGLSMDAFAVSVAKGLATPRYRVCHSATCGLWFGGFQALMPLLGYYLGTHLTAQLQQYDQWVAFILLALIGLGMIREGIKCEEQPQDAVYTALHLLPLAVATSIDALAVGVTFAFLNVQIVPAITIIGITTLVITAVGVRIGSFFGERHAAQAQIVGGVVLILIGLRFVLLDI